MGECEFRVRVEDFVLECAEGKGRGREGVLGDAGEMLEWVESEGQRVERMRRDR